ncbi:MAG: amidohydrolase family protein [Myxococcota bacterium]
MISLLAAVAIVGVTVYTGEGPPLENATILIESNRVQAVGPDVRVPTDARVIEAHGAFVTPGLIDASSRLGVNDVSQEPSSVEATLDRGDPVRAALRVADTYNPASLTIPPARAAGITSAVIVPVGGLISGLSIWVDLAEESPIRRDALALHVALGAERRRGSRTEKFVRLREVLQDTHLYRDNRGPYISGRLRELSVSASDLEVLSRALGGELPVVFRVDRASEIRTALGIIREYELDGVLSGALEGWSVAQEIARAEVPVLLDPTQNLPRGFDALRAREDNALRLHRAGVTVAFTDGGASHFATRLRQLAGNAVAHGYPYEAALAAITSIPARIFGVIDAGSIRPGALANLVVWTGDPLEVSSWATRVFVRGIEVSLQTRQDLLTERYMPVPQP